MIRTDIRENVGHYLTQLMNLELTESLGRGPIKELMGIQIIAMALMVVVLP